MKKIVKRSPGDWVMDILVYAFLIGLVIITIYPMWYVLVLSFSTSTDIAKYTGIILWPKNFTLEAYKLVFEHPTIMTSFKNTLIVLGAYLPLSIIMTVLCGYFMAKTNMLWKKPIVAMIMFTMFFSGGLIPSYLNIKSLGLYNTLWALILPTCLSVYNAIICKTAIEAVPEALRESAYLDGANDIQVLFKVILPLIKPTLAVLTLYYGVARWNDWYQASIYIKDTDLLPIQNLIRAVIIENDGSLDSAGMGDNFNTYAETLKYAAIIISTVPIICIYPFLQKYFAKGVMIGAVKS